MVASGFNPGGIGSLLEEPISQHFIRGVAGRDGIREDRRRAGWLLSTEGPPVPRSADDGPDIGAFEWQPQTNIPNKSSTIINDYILHQNYPNPFNPVTTIEYQLPQADYVSIIVYNILGEKIATLIKQKMDAGLHKILFDGSGLGSGIYYYSIQAGNYMQVKKMILIK